MFPEITRRQALRMFAFGSAVSNVIGQTLTEPLMYELRPLSQSENNGKLRVDLGDFPALGQPLGSVRIGTSPLDPAGQRQLGLFPPVIVNRDAEGVLHCLSAACTHEDCIVRRIDPTTGRMVCPCHGSQFAPDGSVLRGPAAQPLAQRNFVQAGSILWIDLEGIFYEVRYRRISNLKRVELELLAFDNLTYEVHFRDPDSTLEQRVPFALSADGPADQTELRVADDFAKIYVDLPGKAGIFQLVLKTEAV
jgi:Rieske Fe-S protein